MAAAGLVGLAACEGPGALDRTAEGALEITVKSGAVTKASSDVTPGGKEEALDNVQFFLFSEDGALYRRGELDKGTTTQSLDKVKVGSYDVLAVANAAALENVDSRGALERTATHLADNDPSKGFVMAGATASPVSVTASSTAAARADVTLKRFVSRVRITTVENRIPPAYGNLQLDDVFLINGCADWNLGGSGSPTTYVNYAGRKDGMNNQAAASSIIASAGDAQCPSLTYATVNKAVANGATETLALPFYTLPNPLAAAEDHFDGPTNSAVCARLVVKATFGGKSSYYPVTIEKMQRNYTYDVRFIIKGPGSDDPNKKVESGNFDVVVTVEPWQAGEELVGNF